MARLKPLSLDPMSFEDALRNILGVGSAPSKPAPAKAHKRRQSTTRKAKSAKATKKKPKKK